MSGECCYAGVDNICSHFVCTCISIPFKWHLTANFTPSSRPEKSKQSREFESSKLAMQRRFSTYGDLPPTQVSTEKKSEIARPPIETGIIVGLAGDRKSQHLLPRRSHSSMGIQISPNEQANCSIHRWQHRPEGALQILRRREMSLPAAFPIVAHALES